MASRNQNRPPFSNNLRRDGDPLDKRRRVAAGKIGNPVPGDRKPLTSINKDGASSADMASDGSECSSVDFNKEEIDAMINERFKLKKFDHKGNLDLVSELNSRLKVCVRWFQRKVDSHEKEEERLRNALDISERKCLQLETEMKAKEETLMNAVDKLKEENQAANEKVALGDKTHKRLEEYNASLQQYNVKLQADFEASRDALIRVESEKSAIVKNYTSLRGHLDSLQEQLTSARDSQSEAQNEARCLRSELQQVRDERDRQQKTLHELNNDLSNYKENAGKSSALIDNITEKYKSLEETCASQKAQLSLLESQLTSANEKLKMADMSTLETRMIFEEQRNLVAELQERLTEKERLILEGESLRKKLHNTILELKGNIRVFCRVRPSLPEDGASSEAPVLSFPAATEALGRGIDVSQNGQKFPFTFDKVFNPEASQEDVFVEISQLVQSALDGYKVCIFAYGQTGSGKTYTMMGRPELSDQKGLIPRSLEQIFEASQTLISKGWKYKMQASMLEIYNETIRDLLSPSKPNCAEKQYNIKHDAQGTHVSELTVIDVGSIEEISSLLRQAAQSRSVSRTMMNEQSSRSHFVFTLRICGVNEGTEQQIQGVLNLIDLAGSERLSKSGSTGDRLKETQAINKSLSSLADVIFALAKKDDHVPFRNSKLTYLLQPCLVGDSKVLMFVNVSPSPSSVGESLCSLRFAARVNACEIGVPRRQLSIRQQ